MKVSNSQHWNTHLGTYSDLNELLFLCFRQAQEAVRPRRCHINVLKLDLMNLYKYTFVDVCGLFTRTGIYDAAVYNSIQPIIWWICTRKKIELRSSQLVLNLRFSASSHSALPSYIMFLSNKLHMAISFHVGVVLSDVVDSFVRAELTHDMWGSIMANPRDRRPTLSLYF